MRVFGVDVGTTSVRLALVEFGQDGSGDDASEQQVRVLASQERTLGHRQDGDRFQQSTRDIWDAICWCSQQCLQRTDCDKIHGIAFSATCSLVVVQNSSGLDRDDVIMWMDHRANSQAQEITKKEESKVLRQFGGICSPEFSLSKLVWLKQNEPNRLEQAIGLFELPDWLVYKCIDTQPRDCPRSLCSVACKWGFDVDEWDHCDIVRSLGIDTKIGTKVIKPGSISGILSDKAARELGLVQKGEVVVGTSLIDAHSGMLAMLSICRSTSSEGTNSHAESSFESTLCSLAGTSSCHMLLSKDSNFIHGVWGPYKDVLLDGFHLLEAGQTLTGKLIELTIETHHEGRARLSNGESMYKIINDLNSSYDPASRSPLHVLPSYHGNRCPLSNPRLRGGIYGLAPDCSLASSLIEHYIACLESLAYELRLIVETLKQKIEQVLISGGLMKNHVFMQILADVLNLKVRTLNLGDVDLMVMGASLVAHHAAKLYQDESDRPIHEDSITNMSYDQLDGQLFQPNTEKLKYHERKFRCFKEFLEFAIRVDKLTD